MSTKHFIRIRTKLFACFPADVDIQSWAKLHLVRVAMTAAAVTLAVAELALA